MRTLPLHRVTRMRNRLFSAASVTPQLLLLLALRMLRCFRLNSCQDWYHRNALGAGGLVFAFPFSSQGLQPSKTLLSYLSSHLPSLVSKITCTPSCSKGQCKLCQSICHQLAPPPHPSKKGNYSPRDPLLWTVLSQFSNERNSHEIWGADLEPINLQKQLQPDVWTDEICVERWVSGKIFIATD